MSNLGEYLNSMSPEKRLYLLQTLPIHLAEAGQTERLQRVLADFGFLEAKVATQGIQALIGDYNLTPDTRLQSIRQILLQESHILAKAPHDLPSHIHNILQLFGDKIQASNFLQGQAHKALTHRCWLRLTNRSARDFGRNALVRVLNHGVKDILEIAWSPDGKQLATRAWTDVTTDGWVEGGHLNTPRSPARKWSPVFLPQIDTNEPATAWLWDLETGEAIREPWDECRCLAWSPDCTLLAIGTQEGKVSLWDNSGVCQQVLLEQNMPILALAWSPDGSHLAAILGPSFSQVFLKVPISEPLVRVWDITTGTCHFPDGFTEVVTDLFWSSNGNALLIRDAKGALHLWEPFVDARRILSLATDDTTTDILACSPDGTALAVADAPAAAKEQVVHVWDIAHDARRATLRIDANISHLIWSPHGSILAVSCIDQTVRLWEASTGQFLPDLIGYTKPNVLAWTPDESMLAAGYADHTIRIWHVGTATRGITLRGHKAPITALSWSPDSRSLASGDRNHSVRLWDADRFEQEDGAPADIQLLHSFAWSPDAKTLAAGGSGLMLWVWDAQTGQGRKIMDASEQEELKAYSALLGEIRTLIWSPDSTVLALLNALPGGGLTEEALHRSVDSLIILFRVATNESFVLEGHTDAVLDLAWSPDGATLASASSDQTLRLWNIATGQCRKVLKGHDAMITTLAWSPDGLLLASGDTSGIVHVWDASGRHVTRLENHESWRINLTWSPDSSILALATYAYRFFSLYDLYGKRMIRLPYATHIPKIPGREEDEATVEGFQVIIKGKVIKRNLVDSSIQESLLGSRSGMSISWSPDNQTLAATSLDGVIQIWNRNGRPGPTLRGHTNRIRCLAWSPDGRLLASGGLDNTVHLWTTSSSNSLATAHCLASVVALCFSSDGRMLQAVDDGGATNIPVIYLFTLSNIEVEPPIARRVTPLCKRCYRSLATHSVTWYSRQTATISGKVTRDIKQETSVFCRQCLKNMRRRRILALAPVALATTACAILTWWTLDIGTLPQLPFTALILLAIIMSLVACVSILMFFMALNVLKGRALQSQNTQDSPPPETVQ